MKRKFPGLENFPPQVASRVSREIISLVNQPPDGIRYLQTDDGIMSEIHAHIAGPEGTPYERGEFHVRLILGSDYPQSPPLGFFSTKIYHPNVSLKGEICVNTLKRDWNADVSLSHVLQIIRCLLIVPFPESSLNDEAGKFFMEDYASYAQRAALWTRIHAPASPPPSEDSCKASRGSSCESPTGAAAERGCVSPGGGVKGGADRPTKVLTPTGKTSPSKSSKVEKARDKHKQAKTKGLKRL